MLSRLFAHRPLLPPRRLALLSSPPLQQQVRLAHATPQSLRRAAATDAFELVSDAGHGVDGSSGVKSVAIRLIKQHEVVFQEEGPITAAPTMHSLQIDSERHVDITGDGRWTAHSFEPNMYVRVFDSSSHPVEFVALRDIQKGETLSINYNANEWHTSSPFVDEATKRRVLGFKFLKREEQLRLLTGGLLPRHILQQWLLSLHASGEFERSSADEKQ